MKTTVIAEFRMVKIIAIVLVVMAATAFAQKNTPGTDKERNGSTSLNQFDLEVLGHFLSLAD